MSGSHFRFVRVNSTYGWALTISSIQALIRVQPKGGHGLRGLEYKRMVKKKDFYTFSGSFDINSLRDRPRVSNPTNVTLHIRYPICNFGPDFAGYIQIDNVRIEQI